VDCGANNTTVVAVVAGNGVVADNAVGMGMTVGAGVAVGKGVAATAGNGVRLAGAGVGGATAQPASTSAKPTPQSQSCISAFQPDPRGEHIP